ncbi:MAG TPA: RIO1 family regulatory kinase/ATPase [Alphaproteobacteria bacterium]|nr:RIO1 family regulatory kinase/ATPase [Alphaproteobacteria bacterium]
MSHLKGREEWKVYGNVFSKHSLELLFQMSSQGYFENLESTISVGKEANIFTALTKKNDRIICKIYRLENCNFNKMYDYLSKDPRYVSLKKRTRLIIFSWTQREYRNLMLAREVIKVPKPIAFKDNILLMEYIGDDHPAPELKNQAPKDPKKFYKKILDNIKKLFEKGLIHGDLSPFNILNHEEEPVFIDFSQATMTTADNAKELLKRDLHNISVYFRKHFQISEEDELVAYNKIVGKKAENKK